MDKLYFNGVAFNLAMNGISSSTNTLVAKLVTDEYEIVESKVAPVEEIIQKLEDGTKVATYRGFTKLISINKVFNELVGFSVETHDETYSVIDSETGEAHDETVSVAENVPMYRDVLVVTLTQPTLEETVAEIGEQVTEIQEALAEIM